LSKLTEIKKTDVEAPKPSVIYSEKFRVGIGSAVTSVIVFILSFYLSGFSETTSTRDVGIIFAILVGIVPLTLLQLREVKRRDSIDRNLPLFLLALVSAVQSGANLIRAIEQTADRNMGSLTPELKNLRANITWGIPIEDAFENFAQRTGTRMARRVVVLLEMAVKIGGDITSNLEMIQKYVTELQNLEKERKSSLQPYTYTIYISFVVFIGIAVILSSQFFSEIQVVQDMLIDSETAGGESGVFSALKDMDLKLLDSLLFNMAIIEAVFGGLAAGKIGSGSYIAGIKHIVIMVIIAIIAFNVI